jgi:hypothetical protein
MFANSFLRGIHKNGSEKEDESFISFLFAKSPTKKMKFYFPFDAFSSNKNKIQPINYK